MFHFQKSSWFVILIILCFYFVEIDPFFGNFAFYHLSHECQHISVLSSSLVLQCVCPMLRGAPFIKEQASKVGKEEKLKSFRDNWTENSLCPINPSTLIYWIREIPWYLHFSNLLNEPSWGGDLYFYCCYLTWWFLKRNQRVIFFKRVDCRRVHCNCN